MTLPSWRNWGIAPRVILIVVVPVVLMFVSALLYSVHSRSQEVSEELNEHGNLIASLLAEVSEYGVVSGNLDYLRTTITTVLAGETSVSQVRILGPDGHNILDLRRESASDANARMFIAPIRRQVVGGNDLANPNAPLLSSDTRPSPSMTAQQAIGHVEVTVTSARILAKQRQRILVGFFIAAISLAFSVFLGLLMALRITKPLAETIAAVRKIRGGNYAPGLKVTATGEVGELQDAVIKMAASIEELTRDLEHKVHTRTLDLEAARDDALKSNAEKRRLIEKVQSVVEEERKYIAREIHDHLNAELIVIRLEAQRILALAEKDAQQPQLEELNTRARSIVTLVNDLYQSTRGIVRRLRPEVLDTLGLRGALEELVKSYDDLHPGCDFELEMDGSLDGLPEDLPIVVYRLIQEALSNVVRHASARQTKVRLIRDESALAITIQDNGVGFEPNETSAGVGLVGMRERVQSLGGRFAINSRPGAGTTIDIQLPLREP